MKPMHATRLVVVHDDDRETEYEDVAYWPWREGHHLTVFLPGGVQVEHLDVYTTIAGVAA